MTRKYNSIEKHFINIVKLQLVPGKYNYKFIVNGEWRHDSDKKYEAN